MKVNVHVKKVQQVPRPVKALYVDAAMKAISKNWKYFGPHFEGNFRFFTNPQLRSPKDQVKEIVIRADPYYLVPSWNSSTADKSQREKWLKAYKAIISSQRRHASS